MIEPEALLVDPCACRLHKYQATTVKLDHHRGIDLKLKSNNLL